MFWFKKESSKTEEPKITGFFSTDWISTPKHLKSQRLREQLKITFQKGTEHLKLVDANGNTKIDSTFAMDSNCQALSTGQLLNNPNVGIPAPQLSWYAGQGFIGWQTCAILSQNWLIDKACTMPAKDASRHGYEITVNDGKEVKPEILEFIRKQDKAYKIKKNCVEFVKNTRIFGVRIALFVVETSNPAEYYGKPFNPDGIKPGSYKGISQIDPYWCSPELDAQATGNPAAMNFFEPTWWRINGMRIHHTHLVINRTEQVPDMLKPTYIYGGIPIPQKIAERVYASERTANEAPMLAMTKRLTVLNLDITQAVANQTEFEARMNIWTEFMNNYGVKIVGGDEEISQFDTSLADLDDIIMTQFQLVSAASEVPATKLLGTSPKGFNATGEYDESSYHEFLESIQEHDLSPLIDRHHLLLMRSEVMPKFKTEFTIEHKWNPVDSPSAAEQAEINLKKAQTDQLNVTSGAIDGIDVRNRLITDKNSGYNGVPTVSEPLGGGEEENSDS